MSGAGEEDEVCPILKEPRERPCAAWTSVRGSGQTAEHRDVSPCGLPPCCQRSAMHATSAATLLKPSPPLVLERRGCRSQLICELCRQLIYTLLRHSLLFPRKYFLGRTAYCSRSASLLLRRLGVGSVVCIGDAGSVSWTAFFSFCFLRWNMSRLTCGADGC